MNSLEEMLALERPDELQALYAEAYAAVLKTIGPKVSVRGLIEAGNVCAKDCYYCGIRRSNVKVERYLLDEDEMVRLAELAKSLWLPKRSHPVGRDRKRGTYAPYRAHCEAHCRLGYGAYAFAGRAGGSGLSPVARGGSHALSAQDRNFQRKGFTRVSIPPRTAGAAA